MTRGRPLGVDQFQRGPSRLPKPSGTVSLEDLVRNFDEQASSPTPESPAKLPTQGESFDILSMALIDEPKVRPRWHYSTTDVERMALDFLRVGDGNPLNGQITPITVFAKPDGRYEVIDGLTRLKAMRSIQVTDTIKAVIKPAMSAADAYRMGFDANEARTSMSDYDRGMSFHAALEQGVFASQDEIAQSLGVNKSLISMVLKFSKLDVSLLEIIESNKTLFGSTAVDRIHALQERAGLDKAKFAATKITEGWSQQKLREYATKQLEHSSGKGRKRASSNSRPIAGVGKIKFNDKAFSVALDLTNLPADGIARMAEEVERVLLNHLSQMRDSD